MATKSKQAPKKAKSKKASKPSTKAKTANKAVKSKTKATPAKKAKKAASKKSVKKPAPAKKVASKNNKKVKTTKTKNVKKAAPAAKAKKAAPAKKTVVAKQAAKKTIPVKKAVPAPKAVEKKPAPAKPVAKEAAPAKPARVAKRPTKTIVQTKTLTSQPSRPAPSAAARIMKEEKKPTVIIAHRKLENKSKKKDDSGKTMINYQPEYNRSILDEVEEQKGPVYRYSDEELNEFKELILSRLEAARKEMGYLQGLITRKDEAGTEDTENRYMNMEDGSGAMEREQLAQLASRQIQFINHLEKALIRIENKTYGICRVTGKLIDKARLRAVPHATLSIEAKKMMSKQSTQQ